MTPSQFLQAGEVRLAVYRWGKAGARHPTIVLVHGYPDCASVWTAVAERLAARFDVVAYDVRGAGRSSRPEETAAYELEHLVEDLAVVIDAVSPDRAVHLVGHDWGSIQGWEAATTDRLRGRIASYSTISGPSLDHAGAWMKRRIGSGSPEKMALAARQLLHSWYVVMFHLPAIGPRLWTLGIDKLWPAILRKFEGVTAEASATQALDGAFGVKLYRANFLRRVLNPKPRQASMPVQLIVPTRDHFMVPEIWDDLPQWAPRLWRRDIEATHWLPLSHPETLSQWLAEFVDFVEGDPESPGLKRARVRKGVRPLAATTKKLVKTASTTAHRLVPRKVQFDWRSTPLDWIPGQPFASHFINEINLLLPAGEFWFCRLYNQALPRVTDAKLRDDVQMFVRQEAMHARAHAAATRGYLQARGVETDSYTTLEDRLFTLLLSDEPFGRRLPSFLQTRWLVFRLGIIAAVEHMTCVLGKYVLENKTWDEAGADPVLLDLLRWHGAEEIEHRSVAFDLYRHLGGRYPSRYYLALIAFPAVFGGWVHGAAHLMKQDPRFQNHRPSVFRPWIWRQWQRESKTGHLPSPLWLAAQQLSFFSPWYNPVNEASTETALAYLDGSPAAARAAA